MHRDKKNLALTPIFKTFATGLEVDIAPQKGEKA